MDTGFLALTVASGLAELTFEPMRAFSDEALALTFVGIGVVFIALILLALFLALFSTLTLWWTARNRVDQPGTEPGGPIPGEVCAAIALALTLYERNLDRFERTALTIERTQRPYSPWSSKLYGLTKFPERHKEHRP